MPSVMANFGCQLDFIWNQLKQSQKNEAFAFCLLALTLAAKIIHPFAVAFLH